VMRAACVGLALFMLLSLANAGVIEDDRYLSDIVDTNPVQALSAETAAEVSALDSAPQLQPTRSLTDLNKELDKAIADGTSSLETPSLDIAKVTLAADAVEPAAAAAAAASTPAAPAKASAPADDSASASDGGLVDSDLATIERAAEDIHNLLHKAKAAKAAQASAAEERAKVQQPPAETKVSDSDKASEAAEDSTHSDALKQAAKEIQEGNTAAQEKATGSEEVASTGQAATAESEKAASQQEPIKPGLMSARHRPSEASPDQHYKVDSSEGLPQADSDGSAVTGDGTASGNVL